MLFSLFDNPVALIIYLISLFLSITIHEFAHAYVADYLGDPTPRLQGRVSLNPLAHLDPYGTLFIVIFGFGWGRPVQFDPFNLKNPRRDAAFISFAGPASNIILALILALIIRLFPITYAFLAIMIMTNVSLAVFNLLPVHPLDGFKIVGGFLSREQARTWYELERYGYIFLLALILPLGRYTMLDMLVRPVVNFLVYFLLPQHAFGGLM